MSAKHHRHAMHKARGGKTGEPEVSDSGDTAKEKAQEYNAQGSEEAKEVLHDKDGFHQGGKAQAKKHGGKAEGHKAHHRLDRKPRAADARAGKSPFTEARSLKAPESKGP